MATDLSTAYANLTPSEQAAYTAKNPNVNVNLSATQVANTPPAASSGPITADSLAPISPVAIPAAPSSIPTSTSPVSPPISGGATVDANGYVTIPPKAENTSIKDQVASYLDDIKNKGDKTLQLQNDNQLDLKTQKATDSYNAYNTAKKSYQDQIDAMRTQAGGTVGGNQQAIADFTRKANSDIANLGIIAQADQGNLAATEKIIQDKISAEYGPKEDYLKYAKEYLDLNPDLSEADKINIQQKIKQVDAEVTSTKSSKIDAFKAAAENGAPTSVLSAIDAAKTPADVYKALGQYGYSKQDQQYKDLQIQNLQANLQKTKADTVQAITALPTAVQTRVQGVAGQFDAEQAVKNYQTIAETVQAVQTAGNSPTDDIQRIYAFAKVMDPNSAVREGEYKTVADYAQTLLNRYGKNIARVFDNQGFLTKEARGLIDTTLKNRLSSSEKAYKNIYDEYGRRIDKITGNSDGSQYITDYSRAFTQPPPDKNDPLGIGLNNGGASGDPLKLF